MRRRDDPYYASSALATLAFYAGLLALLAAGGWTLGYAFGAGLLALLVWLYRGDLLGLTRWPPKVDVARLLERERLALERKKPEAVA